MTSVLELRKHTSSSPRPLGNLIYVVVAIDVDTAALLHNDLRYFGHLEAAVYLPIDEFFLLLRRDLCSMCALSRHTQENNI